MKRSASVFIVFAFMAFGLLVSEASLASCETAAQWAAENAYGNDPAGPSEVTAKVAGRSYLVKVGMNNSEDGEHDYLVQFNGTCDPRTATVTEVNL